MAALLITNINGDDCVEVDCADHHLIGSQLLENYELVYPHDFLLALLMPA
jgi:hypothetical protein